MKHQEFYFNSHKKQLFGQYWMPQKIKAVVLLVHGMGEHSGRYSDFVVPELIYKQFGVITFDHFGHGHSEGKRGHCPGYQALLDSVKEVFKKTEEVFGNIPVFLYGHSMGGNVVLNYIMRRQPGIKGAVVTSPFLKLAMQPPKWKMIVGRVMQKVYPSITLPSGVDPKTISRIDSEVQKYMDDKLVHDKISPNFSFPVMEAGEFAIDKSHTLSVPLLVLHGTGDKLIDHKATVEFAKTAPYTTLKLYEDAYHELHNDMEREDVINTIIEWMESNL
ncbi:alpha/beta hydrolase [Abyssalbus ytuae]|uniref:Monoacylglycerol lipase n=1 Tax=Abyssalbus ytuae TaxID=2926907 RepID=A0A9E6ZVU1_9FLAO|nr:alpha/beta hydrolase [Abyssalbus ytuae]UOB17731.1 alpha/beta hydrolase [Abyssalbus ytuae]